MFPVCICAHMFQAGRRRSTVAMAVCLVFSGVAGAQDAQVSRSRAELPLPATTGVPLRATFPSVPGAKPNNAVPPAGGFGNNGNNGGSSFALNSGDAPADVRRITLDRLGKSVPVDIIGKNQTAYNFSAVQPLTPLFAVHQLVKIARADENIARAKAGMPVAETVSKVENNYFDLLIADRELVSAEADSKKIQMKWLSASNSGTPSISSEQLKDINGAEKAVVLASSKVKELTASLNEALGLPAGTKLELVPPEPLVEDTSLEEAVDTAASANAAVVEAEQTAVKARAGSTLSKMQYFPSVAIIGGYTNQNALKVILPRDFSYVGFMATYTVFDFGKRERGVKESNAQAEMAEMAVPLTKAKVTAEVKSSYFELERSRKLSQLARRMVSAGQVVEASFQSDNPEVEPEQAKMEADMFRSELEYRQAYARLKNLMDRK